MSANDADDANRFLGGAWDNLNIALARPDRRAEVVPAATLQIAMAQALLTGRIADAVERVAAALERAHPEWVYETQLEHQHAVQIKWGWEALGRLKDDPRYIVYRKAQPWGCPPLEPDAQVPPGGGE